MREEEKKTSNWQGNVLGLVSFHIVVVSENDDIQKIVSWALSASVDRIITQSVRQWLVAVVSRWNDITICFGSF